MAGNKRWEAQDVLDAQPGPVYPTLEVRHGQALTHTGSNTKGTIVGFSEGDRVVLLDEGGRKQVFRAFDGAFVHEGVRVALRSPSGPPAPATRFTASGSVAGRHSRAQVAKASRIWVEGIHDAELIERIWGDDLRRARIVVEPQHGADDLVEAVRAFRPARDRRIGVLLDHLVAGSKEQRIAAAITSEHVMVCGHPYVDIWAALSPGTLGFSGWPEVPPGRPWKEGVLDALGHDAEPGEFWAMILNAVTSYRDLETPLVNAVERLIDFVTVE